MKDATGIIATMSSAQADQDDATSIEQLRAAVEAGLRELIQRCTTPVNVRYLDKVSLEICPLDYGSRVTVCHDEFGGACVNYTEEGLILDVLGHQGDEPLHSATFFADDLACEDDAE